MISTRWILFLSVIILLSIQPVLATSNVQHSVDGNKVTMTYQGTPPFWINIRGDTNIGQAGGYLWAKTYQNSFSYDMGFAINPSKKFYYGVKDSNWSAINNFIISQDKITIWGSNSGFYNFPSNFFTGSTLTPEEVVKITDRIYLLEVELSNGKWLYNSFIKGTYNSTVYGGTTPEGFVLGDAAAPKNNGGHHSWDVIAHEVGHGFWSSSNFYYTLAVPGPFLQESTAVLTAQYVYERIKQDNSHFNLPQKTIESLDYVFNKERNYQKSRYEEYIKLGKPYSQDESGPNYAILTSQAMNYKWFLIGDTYRWDKFPRFYKGFSTDLKDNFTFWQDGISDTEETTYMVAALSVAFGHDFRQDFKDLNFPIDDAMYNKIYPVIKEYVG